MKVRFSFDIVINKYHSKRFCVRFVSVSFKTLFQNEETKQEIQKLVKENNVSELHKRFDERMEFGTAGEKMRQSEFVDSKIDLDFCIFVLCIIFEKYFIISFQGYGPEWEQGHL